MSQVVTEPDTELAVMLLAAGHDEKALWRHAGFASLRDARNFANLLDTRAEVERVVEADRRRLGIKSMREIEKLLDSENTDGRMRVSAARLGLEAAGFLDKAPRSTETKLPREYSVAQLTVMIEATRAELEARIAMQSGQPAALIASS
jgi:hypothetical protein